MADATIDSLSIEVSASTKKAVTALDELSSSLAKLSSGSGLSKVTKNLSALTTALNSMGNIAETTKKLDSLSTSLAALGNIPAGAGLSTAVNSLAKIPTITASLNSRSLSKLETLLPRLAAALKTLTGSEGGSPKGITTTINALAKLPETAEKLKTIDLTNFSKTLNDIARALSPLESALNGVSSGISKLPKSVNQAASAAGKMTTAANRMSVGMKGLGGILQYVSYYLSSFYLINKTISGLASSLKEFNDWVENANLAAVSLGKFADEADAATQKMQDLLGIDASEALRMSGLIQNLTTSFGVNAAAARVMSKNLTQLGYDMASFFNVSNENAFTSLESAITGNTRSIREYGIDISIARLKQEAFALGIKESVVNNMSQADKSILRYIAIMKQSVNAQGDMARTLESPANQLRVFNAQVQLLSRSIGSLLLPMLNTILPPLIAVVHAIRDAIQALAAFFGIQTSFADLTKDYSSGVTDINDGMEDTAAAAGSASKAVKTLIGGFDELNVMGSKNSGGGAAGGAGNLLGLDHLKDFDYDMFAGLVKSKADEMLQKVKDILAKLGPLIGGVAAGFALWKIPTAFMKFMELISKSGGALSVLSNMAPLLMTIGGAILYVNGAFDALKNGVDVLNTLEMIAGTILIITGMTKKFGPLGTAVGGLVTGFSTMAISIRDIANNGLNLSNSILGIAGAVALFVGTKVAAEGAFTALGQAILNIGGPTAESAVRYLSRIQTAFPIVAGVVAVAGAAFLLYKHYVDDAAQAAYEASERHKVLEGIITDANANIEFAARKHEELGTALSNLDMKAEEMQGIRLMVEDVIRLSEEEDKSGLKLLDFQSKVEYLNSLGLKDLQLELDETGQHIKNNVDEIQNVIDKLDEQARMAAMQEVLTEAYKTQYDSYVKMNKAQIEVEAASEAYNEALQKQSDYYSELSGWQKMIADAGLDKHYQELGAEVREAGEAVDLTSQAFRDLYGTYDQATKTAEDMLKGMENLKKGVEGIGDAASEANTNFDKAIDFKDTYDRLTTQADEGGRDVVEGLSLGIKNNKMIADAEMAALTGEIYETFQRETDSHSPSRLYEEAGGYLVEGLANGIEENGDMAVDSIVGVLNSMLERLQRFGDKFADGVNEIFDEFADAMSSLETSGNSVSFRSMGHVRIPALANGGVLKGPGLILAGEYTNARSDPEIVTPQHIMATTMEDVVAAVIAEQTSVLYQGFNSVVGAINDKDTSVVVGDDAIGRANERYNRKMQTARGVRR